MDLSINSPIKKKNLFQKTRVKMQKKAKLDSPQFRTKLIPPTFKGLEKNINIVTQIMNNSGIPVSQSLVKGYLTAPGTKIMYVQKDGIPVGVTIYHKFETDMLVSVAAVERKYQGMGLGTKMVKDLFITHYNDIDRIVFSTVNPNVMNMTNKFAKQFSNLKVYSKYEDRVVKELKDFMSNFNRNIVIKRGANGVIEMTESKDLPPRYAFLIINK